MAFTRDLARTDKIFYYLILIYILKVFKTNLIANTIIII